VTEARGRRVSAGASSERWQEVVDAAAELFYERGYASTTVIDISEALNITKGTLYYYVKSKEDLLFAIISETHEMTNANLRRSQQVQGTPIEKLWDFFAGLTRINTAHLHKSTVGHRELEQLSDPRLRAIIRTRDDVEAYVRGLLSAGAKTGDVCPDLDPALTSILMFSTVGNVHTWYKPEQRLSADEISDIVADYIVSGVRCSPAIHTPGHRRPRQFTPDTDLAEPPIAQVR